MTDHQIHDRFISMFETNLGIILTISKAYTNTLQDREDLVNDIALELWKSYPKFKGESKISTWIYRVAFNTAMNYTRNIRKKRAFIRGAVEIYYDELSRDNGPDPQLEILYDCIAELDDFSKAIILLYLDGNKHEEIAEITGISKSNVGTRILRIKELLKNSVTIKKIQHGN